VLVGDTTVDAAVVVAGIIVRSNLRRRVDDETQMNGRLWSVVGWISPRSEQKQSSSKPSTWK
jgi:hypothetical protein